MTVNVINDGASWNALVDVDLASIGVSAVIGMVAPGAGKLLDGVSKGLRAQEKAIKVAEKVGRRAAGNLRKAKLVKRAKDAAKAEREAWKDLARIGAGVAAGKIAKKIADTVLEGVKEQHGEDVCPPSEKFSFKIEEKIEVDISKLEPASP